MLYISYKDRHEDSPYSHYNLRKALVKTNKQKKAEVITHFY